MSERPALLEALRALQVVLDREGLRWYVFGAQAVVVYGQPRLTADLDDVRGILREQGDRLDLERSRRFLLMLEQALDRSDFVPALERLVEGTGGARF